MRDDIQTRRWRKRTRPAPGFTLIELMIVIVIIGIIMSLLMSAAWDGVRRAQERATQGLIAKLETGISDRLEALLSDRITPTQGHQLLAAIWQTGVLPAASGPRAQVMANIDHIRAEMPDVFLITTGGNYPINFAGAPFLPAQQGGYLEASMTLPCDIYPNNSALPFYSQTNHPTGYYGASVAARAALHKNINPYGKNPLSAQAYDMLDNDGNGLIDDAAEGNWTQVAVDATGKSLGITILTALAGAGGQPGIHQHKTARAEVLYAILVEGNGPLGSVFNVDDFTDKEVQDTDDDGMPEFVDAWGEPLQFYRWPIMYTSDLQKGYVLPPGPYASVFEPREQNPLDPNQLLMSPRWWLNSSNLGPTSAGSGNLSGGVTVFQSLFHSLVEPNAGLGALTAASNWDRGATNNLGQRRAFYSKFLIASSGLDQELGIARIDVGYQTAAGANVGPQTLNVANLLLESQARQTDLNQDFLYFAPAAALQYTSGNTLLQAGFDDITNHNYQAPGGVVEP